MKKFDVCIRGQNFLIKKGSKVKKNGFATNFSSFQTSGTSNLSAAMLPYVVAVDATFSDILYGQPLQSTAIP